MSYRNPRTFSRYSSGFGFTLIELVISITLSTMLMAGIMIFVSSTIGTNMDNEKALERSNENHEFEEKFSDTVTRVGGVYSSGSSFSGGYLTGIFLRTSNGLPVTFIGLKATTGFCDSFSGAGSETGTVMKLAIRSFAIPTAQNTTPYILSSNTVFSGSTRIVGTGHPGNALDTSSGALSELSSPSALAALWTDLYIADTMNDRILAYDTTLGTISELLGPLDGISRPTSLYFSGDSLLIASASNGKIYALSDGEGDGSVFSGSFRVAKDFWADSLKFTFSGIPLITSPASQWDFTFRTFVPNLSDTVSTGTSLMYSGALQLFSSAGPPYAIVIKNIMPKPTTPGDYPVTVEFQSGGVTQYSDTFPYFTKWDGSLKTSTGNILRTIAEGLPYPHNIIWPLSWSATVDWAHALSDTPTVETLSAVPIESFSYSRAGSILTIKYKEYVFYDCLLGKHRTEEHIRKIYLP